MWKGIPVIVIGREELKRMLQEDDSVVLIEVLGPKAFKGYHLPGAVNVPLDEDFAGAVREVVPDKDRPVVVYSMNSGCQASPKAARIMTGQLGYKNVFDYESGKEDWRAAGLPVAGMPAR